MSDTTVSLSALIKRLEVATEKLESLAVPSPVSSQPSTTQNEMMNSYTSFLNGPVAAFISKCKSISNDVLNEQAELFYQCANDSIKELLQTAHTTQKQSIEFVRERLSPVQDLIQKMMNIKDKNRPSPLYNHLTMIYEGAPALCWPLVEPAPMSYITEMRDSAQFYANKILKEFKEKEKQHVELAQSFMNIFTELISFVKQYHTTGLSWNPKGSATPVSTTLPCPPPPGAAPKIQAQIDSENTSSSQQSSGKADVSQLLQSLNRGEGITSGLKKVDKSQMTHKNPSLRAAGVVSSNIDTGSRSGIQSTTSNNTTAKPPIFELDGNKWRLENHSKRQDLVIDQAELKHVVYIYNCNHCTIQIKGKINAVTLDHCSKISIVVDQVVSSVDIVECKSGQMQILTFSPTVVMDNVDSFQLYYSQKSANETQLLTSNCSSINILLPKEDDYVEKAVPSQFKTIVKPSGELETLSVEHSSG